MDKRGVDYKKKKKVWKGFKLYKIRLMFEPELSKYVSKKESLIANKKTNHSTW